MQRHHDHNDPIDDAFDALLAKAMAAYVAKQARLTDAEGAWHYDLVTGAFRLGADAYGFTPIATYVPERSSWLWGWANDAFPPLARERSARLKRLAQKTHYQIFNTAGFAVRREEIDELCALALHELEGLFVFKAKDQSPWMFLVIEEQSS
ncbi:MAG: hypothetical protein JST54_04195 [Deltaproteobacteria bacterium]|nr:hypothetical protein [Deltaproteobacteria bacterium]